MRGQLALDVAAGRVPYRRGRMEDLAEVEPNGLIAAGSFSGCGGAALGLRQAGWDVRTAIEFVPAARDTYLANFPNVEMFDRDIREIEPLDILEAANVGVGELDLWEGSPPCASFSSGGQRSLKWGEVTNYSGGTSQRTDDLFFEWIRLLNGMQPRAFIAENVPGMLAADALEKYGRRVEEEMIACGYYVLSKVVNAAHFGVPQDRRRLVFIGFRKDVGVFPEFPQVLTPWPSTISEALSEVDPDEESHAEFLAESSMEGTAVGRTWEWHKGIRDKGVCVRCDGRLVDHKYVEVERKAGSMVKTADAAAEVGMMDVEAEGQELTKGVPVCADGEFGVEVKHYAMMKMPDPDEPCPTLTADGAPRTSASVVHPFENRKLTPAEMMSISGFPRGFRLTGSREEQWERIGRTVVPPMYRHLGALMASQLKGAE